MPDVEIDPVVFNDTYIPWLDCESRTQIFFGGAGSGKSVFLAQRCIIDILQGRNYLICRQVGRTLRGSVFTELCKVIDQWGLGSLFSINKTDMIITCTNKHQAIFVGLDDSEKLKSLTPQKGALTDVWVEEATETERAAIKQLYKRQRGGNEGVPKRLILSFNPIIKAHWIYEEYFAPHGWADDQTEYKSPELAILKTWYIHNRFLTLDDVTDLENETDRYYRDVYTFGNWGILGNIIFTNWETRDLSKMRDQFVNRRHGLDFGFSSDPAAVVCTHFDLGRKTIYIYDELYEVGLTNDLLADRVYRMIRNERIKCESSEPKSIAELKDHGVNAVAARKGPDSVRHGIQWLQQMRIIIDVSCINTRNEFAMYKWKEDKAGRGLPDPVDRNNHLIDSTRYAYEDDAKTVRPRARSWKGY